MRFAGLDPGKHRDAFAFVGAAVNITTGLFYVKGAKRWLGREYLQIEEEISDKIHRRFPFNYYMLEINNTGTHVYEVLRNKGLPVRRVFTSKDIKDLAKKNSSTIMDKNEMVRHMAHWFVDGTIIFPPDEKLTNDLMELKRQLTIFSEHKTESGSSVAYYAEGNEHDDLVMALMLAVFGAKNFIGRRTDYRIYPLGGRML